MAADSTAELAANRFRPPATRAGRNHPPQRPWSCRLHSTSTPAHQGGCRRRTVAVLPIRRCPASIKASVAVKPPRTWSGRIAGIGPGTVGVVRSTKQLTNTVDPEAALVLYL